MFGHGTCAKVWQCRYECLSVRWTLAGTVTVTVTVTDYDHHCSRSAYPAGRPMGSPAPSAAARGRTRTTQGPPPCSSPRRCSLCNKEQPAQCSAAREIISRKKTCSVERRMPNSSECPPPLPPPLHHNTWTAEAPRKNQWQPRSWSQPTFCAPIMQFVTIKLVVKRSKTTPIAKNTIT